MDSSDFGNKRFFSSPFCFCKLFLQKKMVLPVGSHLITNENSHFFFWVIFFLLTLFEDMYNGKMRLFCFFLIQMVLALTPTSYLQDFNIIPRDHLIALFLIHCVMWCYTFVSYIIMSKLYNILILGSIFGHATFRKRELHRVAKDKMTDFQNLLLSKWD